MTTPGPEPVFRDSTSSAETVSGPQTPSSGSPEFRWRSWRAAVVSGPKMPSTRPQSNPKRARIRCSSATSSPRRFGAVSMSSRSPSAQPDSTRSDQVSSSQLPVGGIPCDAWKEVTASFVESPNQPLSVARIGYDDRISRRWRSLTASPRSPWVSGSCPEMFRTPRGEPICSSLRQFGERPLRH